MGVASAFPIIRLTWAVLFLILNRLSFVFGLSLHVCCTSSIIASLLIHLKILVGRRNPHINVFITIIVTIIVIIITIAFMICITIAFMMMMMMIIIIIIIITIIISIIIISS